MQFFSLVILPHLSVMMTLALAVLIVLNWYNPMLGFLSGRVFAVFLALCVLSNVATAWTLFARRRTLRGKSGRHTKAEALRRK